MYGLTSGNSLSKRQSRWVREIDESVRSNPAQRAFNQESSANHIRDKHNIISLTSPNILDLMNNQQRSDQTTINDSSISLASGQNPILRNDQHHPSNRSMYDPIVNTSSRSISIESLYELVVELKRVNSQLQQQYSRLEQDYQSLKNILNISSEITLRLDRIEQQPNSNDLLVRVSRLEHNNELSSLVNRVLSLERSLSELSHQSNKSPRISPAPYDNSSQFSAPTEPERLVNTPREFLPYFIKQEYSGRDNKTVLTDMHMYMLVDIVGLFDDIPVIYPFGDNKDLPLFSELTLEMSFGDADNSFAGTMYGVFSRGPDGIYNIRITELYSDGEASGIENFTLPLTITCNTDLLPEY